MIREWYKNLAKENSPLVQRPGVFHAYSGNAEVAEELIGYNFYIGIGGVITYQKATELQRISSTLPLETILLETDAPFLTPHPFRGKRNEPGYIQYIAEKLAELHDTSVEKIAVVTAQNSDKLLGWSILS